jgi:asparagine synthase (glutamine-hydrolysing)
LPGQQAARLPLDCLSHRGPDSHGEWTSPSGRVWFGHRRLAILDLSPAGYQPMSDATGRFTIVFNGEVYNHTELRPQLSGRAWRGHSDTETLVELFAECGLAMLEQLRGMFSFAIHDAQDDSVTLARDRLGIKPLYFRHGPDGFSFSSETRALLSGEAHLPPAAREEYFSFGRLPAAGALAGDVQSLPPGGQLVIDAKGEVKTGIWWPKQIRASAPQDRAAAMRGVRELLESAVEEHLLSDVEVASFLSGGIDSSIITLLAARKIGSRLKTFAVVFPQKEFDERKVARQVAELAGTEHHEIEISLDQCLGWTIEAVERMDLPSVDAVNTYIVSKAVREQGIKVALSGLGGDELFGGYSSFRDVPPLSFLGRIPPSLARALVRLMPAAVREKLDGLGQFDPATLAKARRRMLSRQTATMLGLAQTPLAASPSPWEHQMGQISWAEIEGYMIPMLLRDSDQMSMAASLELRVPFLDHRLVEYVLALPDAWKRGKQIKPLLVASFADLLPREVYDRPKQGFALPMAEWMCGPLREFCARGLAAFTEAPEHEFLQTLSTRFQDGKVHWTRLWQWVVLGHWLQRRA